MDDVAALAGHGKSQDALATLESALRPVERYAVHFLEEVRLSRLPHAAGSGAARSLASLKAAHAPLHAACLPLQ